MAKLVQTEPLRCVAQGAGKGSVRQDQTQETRLAHMVLLAIVGTVFQPVQLLWRARHCALVSQIELRVAVRQSPASALSKPVPITPNAPSPLGNSGQGPSAPPRGQLTQS